jgi:cytoskeletal protein RodZ
MTSIGQQLSHAREARNLSIEDVAFHTRVPPGRLRDMENDDLSKFANLTYARGFLQIYSRFLELDISDYLSQFSSAEFATASGHEYVQTANATQNLPAAVFTDYGRARHPGVFVLICAAIAAGGIIWWSNRDSTENKEPLRDPSPKSSSTVASDAVPPPATDPAEPPPVPPAVPPPVETPPLQPPAKPPKAIVVEDEEEQKEPLRND